MTREEKIDKAVRQEIAGLVQACKPGRGIDPSANPILDDVPYDDELEQAISDKWIELSNAIVEILG